MTLEEQLINKSYYEKTFMDGNETRHPIQVLGEVYIAEQMKEVSELSHIRFAQGELYFHFKDYEAAIFKWENIDNELEEWARKNMADAYLELGLFSTAEEIYNSISTESSTLTTEVSLKLFSIYIEQGKLDRAVEIIKETVAYNPDYPNVTETARHFFEKHQDWNNAVELTVNESIRTQSVKWFDILLNYIEWGKTKKFPPSYFSQVLVTLYIHDRKRFETVVAAFWNSYRNEESCITWLKEINDLFLNIEEDESSNWREMPKVYMESYLQLMDGHLFNKELNEVMPNHLVNWLKLASVDQTIFVSTAVLAWSEIFPNTIEQSTVYKAEALLVSTKYMDGAIEDSLTLFQGITDWANSQNVQVRNHYKNFLRELLNFESYNVLVASANYDEKSTFIKHLLGDSVDDSQSVVFYKDYEDIEIKEITESEIISYSYLSDYYENQSNRDTSSSLVEFKLPSRFLNENKITLIDAPVFTRNDKNGVYQYLHMADDILFVLSESEPFNDEEAQILFEIKKYAPNARIHFLVHQEETSYDHSQQLNYDEILAKIHAHFPNSFVLPYSLNYLPTTQLSESIYKNSRIENLEDQRGAKILFFIRKLLSEILEQRLKLESDLEASIEWDEQMVAKLNGAMNQLEDLKKEKTNRIIGAFTSIKEDIREDIRTSIPTLIKDCSELITEDSDFRKIHLDLNEEMNDRIENYLKNTALPKFYQSIQNWINNANEDFIESRIFMEEMSEGFNTLFREEKINLTCDFKVIDDWRRDAQRMKNGVQVEKVNILLRHTPSQVLLKSASKLFGSISQNKAMLYNRYKKFIENENYQDIVSSITDKFLKQFELFEQALERDISMFFQESFPVLEKTVIEMEREIKRGKETFAKLKANPETYRDPLTLFEVRLRQLEWVIDASKEKMINY